MREEAGGRFVKKGPGGTCVKNSGSQNIAREAKDRERLHDRATKRRGDQRGKPDRLKERRKKTLR